MSVKKWSLLGVILMGASAVTAAIMPKNTSSGNRVEQNGSITASSVLGETLTCKVSIDDPTQPCHASTAVSGSTVGAALNTNRNATVNNTTIVGDIN